MDAKPTFEQKGLKGYAFPLKNKDIEVYLVDVTQGHDTYFISKKCFHIYYVLAGKGKFVIDSKVKEVAKDSFIEVEPGVEYTYSGKMKLLLIMKRPELLILM